MNRWTIPAALLLLLAIACGSAGASDPELTARGGPMAGAKLFNMHCTLCHGQDGRLGNNGAKDLTASQLTREEMIALVSNGRGVMAAYKNVLSPAEIDAVVAYVRTLHAKE